MSLRLTPFQDAFVLSCFPSGTRVTSARTMQEQVPCPVHVRVTGPDGNEKSVVLRIARNRGGVEREALLFPVLAQLGLPVPAVLAGPVSDPSDVHAVSMSLHSLLPGNTLQDWSVGSSHGLAMAMDQVIEAVSRLHAITDRLLQTETALVLPHKTLTSELQGLIRGGNQWMREPRVEAALSRLAPLTEAIDTPLVFSNGDYQPANFLSDGGELTGFVDFEKACFEDPLITWTRYPVYDLNPLHRAGVVTRFLAEKGFSQQDFAPRLALFCLRALVTKVPISGGTNAQQERREHVLAQLNAALSHLA